MVRRGVVIPVGRLKFIEERELLARLCARLAEAAAAKAVALDPERRATWMRVLARLERPRSRFEKLPQRTVRAARRLFGAFKRLGPLKATADPPSSGL